MSWASPLGTRLCSSLRNPKRGRACPAWGEQCRDILLLPHGGLAAPSAGPRTALTVASGLPGPGGGGGGA